MMYSKTYFKEIIRNVKQNDSFSSFRIKGKTLYRDYNEALQLINFQGSSSYTANSLKFTINLGIYLKQLAVLEDDPELTTNILDSHWSDRIGSYTKAGIDHWWTVQSAKDVETVSDEIIHLLTQCAIPSMNELSSIKALCEVWKRGERPGIFEPQRQRYLDLLSGN